LAQLPFFAEHAKCDGGVLGGSSGKIQRRPHHIIYYAGIGTPLRITTEELCLFE
jgi:hypothetical protein